MGNDSWMDSAFFLRHLVPQNIGNLIFGCYFLNIGIGPKKINGLAICSKNQFRDYFIRNRLEKLVPLNWNFAPRNLKNRKKRPTCFQTLTFCRNLSFQKSWICPWISKDFPPHGFPTPWILDFRGGRGSGRQKTRLDADFFWAPSLREYER